MRATPSDPHARHGLHRALAAGILAALIFVSAPRVQSQAHVQKSNSINDWQTVRNLPSGTDVSVRAGHRIRCVFESATDSQLTCVRIPRGAVLAAGPANIALDRSNILEVRIEHSAESNSLTGIAVGAGIGVAIGASGTGCCGRGPAMVVAGGIGALVGGLVGRDFSILPGRIIYRR